MNPSPPGLEVRTRGQIRQGATDSRINWFNPFSAMRFRWILQKGGLPFFRSPPPNGGRSLAVFVNYVAGANLVDRREVHGGGQTRGTNAPRSAKPPKPLHSGGRQPAVVLTRGANALRSESGELAIIRAILAMLAGPLRCSVNASTIRRPRPPSRRPPATFADRHNHGCRFR